MSNVSICDMDMSTQPNYYEFDNDNSPGCYVTNYVLVFLIVIYVAVLYVRRKAKLFDEHTRFFVLGKFVCLGCSILFAGFVHHRGADFEDTGNKVLWAITEVSLVLTGSFTVCAALSALSKLDNTKSSFRTYLAAGMCGTALSVYVCFLDNSFAIAGAFGEILPNLVFIVALLIAAGGCIKRHSCLQSFEGKLGAGICSVAVLVIIIGAAIQASMGSTCGVKCPSDCALPAPSFNHNALFHLIQAIGMGLFAWGSHMVCSDLEIQVKNRVSEKRGTECEKVAWGSHKEETECEKVGEKQSFK